MCLSVLTIFLLTDFRFLILRDKRIFWVSVYDINSDYSYLSSKMVA